MQKKKKRGGLVLEVRQSEEIFVIDKDGNELLVAIARKSKNNQQWLFFSGPECFQITRRKKETVNDESAATV